MAQAAAAAAVVLALGATAAPAAWSPPFDVSTPSASGPPAPGVPIPILPPGFPQVAVDARGNATFLWYRFDAERNRLSVQARVRPAATGVLGPVIDLSDVSRTNPEVRVAVDARGNAVLVWLRSCCAQGRVQVRTLSATGVLGRVIGVSPAGANAAAPRVGIGSEGDAVLAWRSSTSGGPAGVQARTLSAAGELGPTLDLSAAGERAGAPELAVAPSGRAIVAWDHGRRGDPDRRLQARTLSTGGALGPIVGLSAPGARAIDQRVAIADDGRALVSWGRAGRVQARMLSAHGVRGPVIAVSSLSRGESYDAHLVHDVALAPDGSGVLTWRRSGSPTLHARMLTARGVPGPSVDVSAPGERAHQADVVALAAGGAIVAWMSFDAASIPRVRGRTLPAAGAPEPIVTLSAPGERSEHPQLAVGAGGHAVAAWGHAAGGDWNVQAAAGP